MCLPFWSVLKYKDIFIAIRRFMLQVTDKLRYKTIFVFH